MRNTSYPHYSYRGYKGAKVGSVCVSFWLLHAEIMVPFRDKESIIYLGKVCGYLTSSLSITISVLVVARRDAYYVAS